MNASTDPGVAAVTGAEHWTTKGADVRLFLWQKYVGSPDGKPCVLFVHGSSMASTPTFDLTVPGRPDSSVMDWFARRGFECWCFDMEGYGRSSKHRDIVCDIANGADDLEAATSYIMRTRGVGKFLVYGISSGALRAGLFAERHPGLLPDDANGRARTIAWMFAALNTVEPPIFDRDLARILERDKPWFEQRLHFLEDIIQKRLSSLSENLGDADWLNGAFGAGDLLMVTVLRRLNGSSILETFPNLVAYVARGEARPAFKRAFEAQRAAFVSASAS